VKAKSEQVDQKIKLIEKEVKAAEQFAKEGNIKNATALYEACLCALQKI
jgi:hypothetical protein